MMWIGEFCGALRRLVQRPGLPLVAVGVLGAGLLATTLLAIAAAARRVLRIEPVEALRHE